MTIYLVCYDYGHEMCTYGNAFSTKEKAQKFMLDNNWSENDGYVEEIEVDKAGES